MLEVRVGQQNIDIRASLTEFVKIGFLKYYIKFIKHVIKVIIIAILVDYVSKIMFINVINIKHHSSMIVNDVNFLINL